ncbi:MAG: N-6 DNA methylase [Polaromonas sp.]|uniref:HsdM family class I SAM-dependent methyltransferase n=1 Tax=Polaromonas sp. TaxID=1869339 RepID=UPI002487645A|nr:N-6 DNA methylase [Polaromonas sp.]MDI1236657.1 N-6 DNA methylase [Polaromonas sp.]
MEKLDIAKDWSQKLGLALSGLFGTPDRHFGLGEHYALLDGVGASFSLSVAQSSTNDPRNPASWAWSANLRKHVWVDTQSQKVTVTSVARPESPEPYSISDVNSNLDRFLEYLSGDRQSPKATVVDSLLRRLDYFRESARSLGQVEQPDLLATRTLLLFMAQLTEPGDTSIEELAEIYHLPLECVEQMSRILEKALPYGFDISPPENFQLHCGIAIRHAGGAIFQRATAQLTFSPQYQLFTGRQTAQFGAPDSLQHGGYFTPPGLARSLAEAAIQGKTGGNLLRICDPSCGSGVFLAEVVRALARANYAGRIELVGRDISPYAVQIARFVALSAARDLDVSRISLDINLGNTLLEPPLGDFDIILMNPPFRSWEQSSGDGRASVKQHLDGVFAGKPDLSLAFANLAYGLLKPGGVLATILPIGVLTSDYSRKWREKISQEAEVSLIGSLGDHYIFDYAMVNIAALVVRRSAPSSTLSRRTLMLWANEDPRASSAALRSLRRGNYQQPDSDGLRSWRTYQIRQGELTRRTSWAPSDAGSEGVIEALRLRNFPRLADLFKVQQGIRTGARAAFVLTNEQVAKLPKEEHVGFRPIAEKDGIFQFKIVASTQVFFADSLQRPILSELDFRNRYPAYFEEFIEPNLDILRKRPRNPEIWELSWDRAWLRKFDPRIVSRMFLGQKQLGFAVDETGRHAVVQGYGWNPVWRRLAPNASLETKLIILHAYAFLFASDFFLNLVKTVSVNIAGGQYDLAPKYIDELPIPDWNTINNLATGFDRIETVRELANIFVSNPLELEKFAHAAFGVR